MYLGLIKGPFVLHNLVIVQESPLTLSKLQMAPRLKIVMGSGSKKGTQIYFSFLSKIPSTRTPSRFPKRAPMESDTLLRVICISLKNLIKIPLNRKVPRKKRPFMFPKNGALMEAHTYFRTLLNPLTLELDIYSFAHHLYKI